MAQVLTAFCDLQYCPISFDFVTWLVHAALERERRKCDGLHVVLVPHEGGLGGFSRKWGAHDEAAARWRLWHIVVASCPLVGATVTVAASRKQAEQLKGDSFWWPEGKTHHIYPLVDAARNGDAIPKLLATEQARRYVKQWVDRPYVTLTTREQSTDPVRNSNRAEWQKLCDSLMSRYGVIWLDDTNKALQEAAGNYAELDVDLRLALYEQAQMNFIGNNGPQALLSFSGAPYRGFIDKAWPEHWKKYFHMSVGEQLPWATENQRLVYKPDTFEVMRDSWDSVTNS